MKPIRTINAAEVIKALDPESDTYAVMHGLADAVRVLGERYVKWKGLAILAVIGNIVQWLASRM
jgi:hypothetical protein